MGNETKFEMVKTMRRTCHITMSNFFVSFYFTIAIHYTIQLQKFMEAKDNYLCTMEWAHPTELLLSSN
jgi:hypothetical protein